ISVAVAVTISVAVAVAVTISVAVAVTISVAVAVTISVAVAVTIPVAAAVTISLAVAITISVAVAVTTGVIARVVEGTVFFLLLPAVVVAAARDSQEVGSQHEHANQASRTFDDHLSLPSVQRLSAGCTVTTVIKVARRPQVPSDFSGRGMGTDRGVPLSPIFFTVTDLLHGGT